MSGFPPFPDPMKQRALELAQSGGTGLGEIPVGALVVRG